MSKSRKPEFDDKVFTEEIARHKARMVEIKSTQKELADIHAKLNAVLAFEDVAHKLHIEWRKQLEYCEEKLKQLKEPLKINRK